MSRLVCIHDFVADLLLACELSFFKRAVACRPVASRLWSGFLVGLLYLVCVAPIRDPG